MKSLLFIPVKEDNYKADFDLANKYQGYSAELIRLSILGIAGYGFLVSAAKNDILNEAVILTLKGYPSLIVIGIISLGLASGFGLAHRFYSSESVAYQIEILRLKEAMVEDTSFESRLDGTLRTYRNILRLCSKLLRVSALLLIFGILMVVIFYSIALFSGVS